jgi:ribosomal protein S4
MSALRDTIVALKEVLKLTDDVKGIGERLKEVAGEMREQDRRITRLEARLDTMVEMARLASTRSITRKPGPN